MRDAQENAETKLLTISVAAYNAEGWLARCLESLLSTDVSPLLDIIVVNDGSSDGTLKIARAFEKANPGVVSVIDKANGGHGSTINAAIEHARGKYFKIVDADDWVERDGLSRLVKALDAADADLILNELYVVNAETGAKRLAEDCFDKKANRIGVAMSVDDVKGSLSLVMHAMTFRTRILKESSYRLDEHCFYVDNEYIVYYFSACETVMLLDWPVYDYLLGTAEQSMNFANLLRRRRQHEKVCLACGEFYAKHPELTGVKEQVIRRCALRMLAGTYRILLCLPYESSRNELQSFDRQFKNASPYLYERFLIECAGDRTARIVRRLRTRGFARYRITSVLYRIKHRCLGKG